MLCHSRKVKHNYKKIKHSKKVGGVNHNWLFQVLFTRHLYFTNFEPYGCKMKYFNMVSRLLFPFSFRLGFFSPPPLPPLLVTNSTSVPPSAHPQLMSDEGPGGSLCLSLQLQSRDFPTSSKQQNPTSGH